MQLFANAQLQFCRTSTNKMAFNLATAFKPTVAPSRAAVRPRVAGVSRHWPPAGSADSQGTQAGRAGFGFVSFAAG